MGFGSAEMGWRCEERIDIRRWGDGNRAYEVGCGEDLRGGRGWENLRVARMLGYFIVFPRHSLLFRKVTHYADR